MRALLSKSAAAAISAASRLAETHGRDDSVQTAAAVAAARGIPRPFVAKVLSVLSLRGLVRGTPGRRGGYELARPPEEISLYDVACCFDRLEEPPRCPLGRAKCDQRPRCLLHDDLEALRLQARGFLQRTPLARFRAAGPALRSRASRRRASSPPAPARPARPTRR
jgi:Rrf2 family protein